MAEDYESLIPALFLLPPAGCDPRACCHLPLLWCDLERGWQPQGALVLFPAGTHFPAAGVIRKLRYGMHTHLLWPPENGLGQL